MIFCDVCGNELQLGEQRCPHCGAEIDETQAVKPVFQHRLINLEEGRPTAEVAINKLLKVIDDAHRNKVSVITFIHGYGSSGKGGVIKEECHKTLVYLKTKGEIQDYIPGEKFSKHQPVVRELLRRYPKLTSDRNLNKSNRGITVVVLF
jgi:hypothetical protein